MIQSNLKLVDFSLELLLNAKSLSLGTLFSFNGSSERVHSAGMILPGIVEFVFSLSNTSVNVLSDLSKFKLSAENLVLLHLKSSLSFLQSSLELLLFGFKSPALLVQIVNRSSTISELVKEILDFIGEILVLTLDNIKSFSRFGLSSLKSEQFRAVVPSFILRSGDFSGNIGCLGLPFTKDLVKVLGSLLGDQGSSVDTLIFHGNVIKIGGESSLGLFGIGNLGLEDIDQLFILNNLGLQFGSGSLKLFDASHSFSFIPGFPQLNFGLGLGIRHRNR